MDTKTVQALSDVGAPWRNPRVAENAPAVFEHRPDIPAIQERFKQVEGMVAALVNLVGPRCDEIVSNAREKPEDVSNGTEKVLLETRRLATEMLDNLREMERILGLPENFVSALERTWRSVSESMRGSSPELVRFRIISETLELLRHHLGMDYAGIWLLKNGRGVSLHESGKLHPDSDLNVIEAQVQDAIGKTEGGKFAYLDPSDSEDGGVDAVFVFRNIEGDPIGYLLLDDYETAHDIDTATISKVAETYYVHLHAVIHEEEAALAQKELFDIRRELDRMRDELESSRFDLLTGLLIRRYGTEKISNRMEQVMHSRDGDGIGTLCIFDIDRFKTVNDTYGHSKGDEVLHRVGEILAKGYRSDTVSVTPRKLDVMCRWWGEEFVAYLDQTDEAGAVVFAERISKAVQDLEFEDVEGVDRFRVSVTMGIVGFTTESLRKLPSGTDVLEHCLSRADGALYEGKETGRNRIVVCKDGGQYEIFETGTPRN